MDNDLPITVPQELHDAIRDEFTEAFAVSYLCGAIVDRGVIYPRTDCARRHLLGEPRALKVFEQHRLHLGAAQRPKDRIEIPAVTDAAKRYDRTGHF